MIGLGPGRVSRLAEIGVIVLYGGGAAAVVSGASAEAAAGPVILTLAGATVLLGLGVRRRRVAAVPLAAGLIVGVVSAAASDTGDQSPIGVLGLWFALGAALTALLATVVFIHHSARK